MDSEGQAQDNAEINELTTQLETEREKVRICEMLHRNGNVKKSFEDWFKWLAVFAAILAVMTSLSNLLQYRCS